MEEQFYVYGAGKQLKDIYKMNTAIECKPLMDCVIQFNDCIGACNICHRTVPFWLKSGQNVYSILHDMPYDGSGLKYLIFETPGF